MRARRRDPRLPDGREELALGAEREEANLEALISEAGKEKRPLPLCTPGLEVVADEEDPHQVCLCRASTSA